MTQPTYGDGDTSFRSAGGEAGIRQLVDHFYDIMSSDPAYATIWHWHPDDHGVSRDKLARFLCSWMGGPRLYREKYGTISIPGVHAHLNVQASERDQWLGCMQAALERMDYAADFKRYLLRQLAIPAQRVVQVHHPDTPAPQIPD